MKRAGLAAVAVIAMALVSWPATAGTIRVGHAPLVRLSHRANATTSSTNWSGYATYNTTFTDVKGSWTQPAVSCPSGTKQYSSFWVGIDGYKSSSVEQIGTDSDCAGTNRPSYYAWYEMYPNPMVQISSSSFSVHAGDVIAAEVSFSGGRYTLTLANSTTGKTFTTSQSASAANASAEWVAEAPSGCSILVCRVLPLANFHTVNFTGSFTTSNGATKSISGWTNDEIVMASQTGTVKAQPSGLSPDGTGFSVTWKHS